MDCVDYFIMSISSSDWLDNLYSNKTPLDAALLNVRDHRLASKQDNPLAAIKASNLPPRNEEENKVAQALVKNWTADWSLALAQAEKEKRESDEKTKRDPAIKQGKARSYTDDELKLDVDSLFTTKALDVSNDSVNYMLALNKKSKGNE